MKKYVFWAVTGLFSLAMLGSGAMDLIQPASFVEAASKTGFPMQIASILGFWKVLGVVALVVPGFPLVKEWAYAGFFFAMSGAVALHVLTGDVGGAVPAFVLLLLEGVSYFTRPSASVAPELRLASA